MSVVVRVLVFVGLSWTLFLSPGMAQFPEAYPRIITFVATAHTLLSEDQPPTRFFGVAPAPLGVDSVPFQVSIRLENLPTGEATNFVIVSPSSGIAASGLSGIPRVSPVIALNPKVVPYMRPGTYSLTVLVRNPEHPEFGSGGVFVYLTLKPAGFPEIASVVNAASQLPAISPGQLVTIRGTHLSTPPVTAEADGTGLFPKVMGHTRVTFNGIPAPLLYVSNERIDCVVPHGVAGSQTAEVVVDLLQPAGPNDSSPAVTVPVSDTSPGIYTADESGSGPGAILNSGDTADVNTESNPAPPGTAITFSATGAGAWNIPFPDGALVLASMTATAPPNPEFLAPVAPVSVTIGGQPAKVIQATAKRNRVSGMLLVTVEIPEGIGSGAQPLVLRVGEKDTADQNVTVWVR